MDGNKDEAQKCVALGEKYLAEGKYDKAEKFLSKAQKLYPTSKAENLLESLKTMPKTRKASASPSRNKSGPSTAQAAPEEPTYTTEQLEVVRRINEGKDPYQILEVTKECTDSDVKKAYKKLALKVHPDKNKAPGAVEAFKSLGLAVAILTDPEKRMRYDSYTEKKMRYDIDPEEKMPYDIDPEEKMPYDIDPEEKMPYDKNGDESREQPRQAYQYNPDLKGFILVALGVVGFAAAGMWLYKKSKESRKRDSDKEDSSVQPMEH